MLLHVMRWPLTKSGTSVARYLSLLLRNFTCESFFITITTTTTMTTRTKTTKTTTRMTKQRRQQQQQEWRRQQQRRRQNVHVLCIFSDKWRIFQCIHFVQFLVQKMTNFPRTTCMYFVHFLVKKWQILCAQRIYILCNIWCKNDKFSVYNVRVCILCNF